MSAIADRYRRLAHRFTEMIDAVPAQQWDAASPCEGWSARDVVEHVTSTERDFLSRMGFDAPSPAEWPAVRDAVQARLDDPADAGHEYDGMLGRTTFGESIDTFYCMDLVVHGWDLARAAGLESFLEIPSDELATVRVALEGFGDNARLPGVFGPALAVGADADDQTRLLADLGRQA